MLTETRLTSCKRLCCRRSRAVGESRASACMRSWAPSSANCVHTSVTSSENNRITSTVGLWWITSWALCDAPACAHFMHEKTEGSIAHSSTANMMQMCLLSKGFASSRRKCFYIQLAQSSLVLRTRSYQAGNSKPKSEHFA